MLDRVGTGAFGRSCSSPSCVKPAETFGDALEETEFDSKVDVGSCTSGGESALIGEDTCDASLNGAEMRFEVLFALARVDGFDVDVCKGSRGECCGMIAAFRILGPAIASGEDSAGRGIVASSR